MSTPFCPSEEARKALRPRRSLPGSAAAPTERSAKALVARLAKAYQGPTHFHERRSHAAIFAAGLKTTTEPALAPLRREAHELLLRLDLDALRAAELEVLAAADTMVARVDREPSLTPAITVARGLTDAVRVAWRAWRYGLSAASGGWTTAVWLVSADERYRRRGEPWPVLRHEVCASSEEAYAAAREEARALRAGSDRPLRAALASAFPDEPWGNEELLAAREDATLLRSLSFLLSATSSVEAVRACVAADGAVVSTYALDLAHALPCEEVLPILAGALPALLEKPKYGPLLKTPPRQVAQAIACFRCEEAAAILAPHASSTVLGPLVLGYFRDAPELGHVLEGQARGKTKLGGAIERVLGKQRAAGKAAAAARPGEVPALLALRPWRAQGSGKREVVRGLQLLGEELARVVIDTPPAPFVPHGGGAVRAMSRQELAAWRAEVEKNGWVGCDYGLQRGPKGSWVYLVVPDDEGLRAWNRGLGGLRAGERRFVARHGLAALPGFLARPWLKWLAWEGHDETLAAALQLVSPRMAPSLALLAGRKRQRRVALAWLLEHAEVAACGLVPDAVGEDGAARRAAEAALLFLAQKGKDAVVRRAARRYGAAASKAIAALLDRDPLALEAHVPKPPAFLRLAELPPLRARSGRVLPEEARAALVELLQVAPLEPPYPGIALLRDACDEASLAELALELTEQWVLGDAPGRHDWMLLATVRFPSEAASRRVASLAREWARRDQKKAERACLALAALGTDLALLHLAHIAETTRFDALRKHTAALLLEAAAERGLTADELGDRTVPELGLEADGTLDLSYGARSFVVSLDEALAPVVRERQASGLGERLRTLPRPAKGDDAAAAKAARARFDALKKDLAAVADRQRRRLERAMADERAWPLAELRLRVLEQPLLLHLARRLLWEACGGRGASRLFRVAEDGSFADERDRTLKLGAEHPVRLAHPARDPERVAAWRSIFFDYGILQPFEQLGRATVSPTAAEARAKELARCAGATAKAAKVLGVLESRGWRRNDAGLIACYLRDVRAADGSPLVARLPLSPGISLEDLKGCPEQTTGALVVEREGRAVTLGELAAVSFSEVLRDVEALRS